MERLTNITLETSVRRGRPILEIFRPGHPYLLIVVLFGGGLCSSRNQRALALATF